MDQIKPNSSSMGVLPSFKTPPVNEVVCGMRFRTPDNLRIPHLGIFWEKFQKEYPIIQHAMPITGGKGELLIDNTTGFPLPRVWFINKTDDQLIQFQFDRFYFNWRRRQNSYPRYPHLFKNFEKLLDSAVEFFSENELGEFVPTEYELSYINHIPKGQGWNTIEDLSKIFTDFSWNQKKRRFLPNPTNITWQTGFLLPEEKGRLTVNLKEAVRADDKTPLFVFELIVRGFDEQTNKGVIRKWFDLAHEWIVKGFTDLTTPEIQKTVWERE